MRAALISLLIAALTAPPLLGQGISPGRRLRFSANADSVPRVGIVDSISHGRIWLRPALGAPHVVELAGLRTVEISQGRRPALGKGLAFGALGGVAVGGALWLALVSGDPYEEYKNLLAAVYLGSGAVGGALAGAGVSLILARDRWQSIPRGQWPAVSAWWKVGLSVAAF
ncbi:MAG: hypothetical protein ACKVZ0_12385 [Gemmatimonadales bacterium]